MKRWQLNGKHQLEQTNELSRVIYMVYLQSLVHLCVESYEF